MIVSRAANTLHWSLSVGMCLWRHNQKWDAGSDILIMESDEPDHKTMEGSCCSFRNTCVRFLLDWHEIGTHAWKWCVGLAKNANILKSRTCFLSPKKPPCFFIIYTQPKIAQFPALHPQRRVHFPFLKPHGFVLQFCMTRPHCDGAIWMKGFNVYAARFKHECLYILYDQNLKSHVV